MNIEELLKAMFRSYFMIATGTVASMYVFCLLFYPNAVFTLHDIGRILLMAFFTDLPFLIFYSGKELSKKQMYIRQSVHLLAILTIVLYFAYLWNWVSLTRTKDVLVFLLLVLVVYAIVFMTTTYHDKKLADKLNHRLRERYHSQ
jgi:hypothetical protein